MGHGDIVGEILTFDAIAGGHYGDMMMQIPVDRKLKRGEEAKTRESKERVEISGVR